MEFSRWVLAFVTISFLLFGANGEAGTIVRDFSGDAMQRHDSRMMALPLQRIPPLWGLSWWPFTPYLPAPSLTVVNIEINFPTLAPPSPIPPPPTPARPKLWINRCGTFVEIEVNPATNLTEEEQTPCSN
ncbi:MAG: hypothetical protein OEW32_12300 [Nitrospira sp.]|nr:hypothetical protein [Nitrospira sp.]